MRHILSGRRSGGGRFARFSPLIVAGCLLSFALSPPQSARAADFTVTTCDEAHFRAAVASAQAASGNRVVFACDGTITLTSGAGGQITVANTLTLDGAGHAVTISGGQQVGLFLIGASGVTFSVNMLTLDEGKFVSGNVSGGAISNAIGGTVNVTHSTVSRSHGDPAGNGIYNGVGGTVNITNSAILQNGYCNPNPCAQMGAGDGINNAGGTLNVTNSTLFSNGGSGTNGGFGAIYNHASGTLNVTNSTFNSNGGANGGAIHNDTGGTANVTNSTFSVNPTSQQPGGMIYNNGGTLNLTNCTLAENPGSTGLANISGTATVINSLIVDNAVDLFGTLSPASKNNLIGPGNPAFFTFANNETVVSDNGGPTATLAIPTPANPGTNDAYQRGDLTTCQNLTYAGTAIPLTYDQRGAPRVVGGKCSIGAVEPGQVNTATTLTANPTSTGPGGRVTLTATVTGVLGVTPPVPLIAVTTDLPPDGGVVTFTNGATTLGTAPLASGAATLTTTALPLGTDSVTAGYGGSGVGGNYAASPASNAVTVTIVAPNVLPGSEPSAGPAQGGLPAPLPRAAVQGQGTQGGPPAPLPSRRP